MKVEFRGIKMKNFSNHIITILSLLTFILIREQVFVKGYYVILTSSIILFLIGFIRIIKQLDFERGD